MDLKHKEDLEYFLKQATSKRGKELDSSYPNEMKHLNFYHLHSKEELNLYVESYLKVNKIANKYDFLFFMNTLIKYMSGASDAHTAIWDNNDISLPINIKCIDDNVYIDYTHDGSIKKARILSVNDVDIKVIIRELESCLSYGTNMWLKHLIEFNLSKVSMILSLPSIDSNSKFIEFKTTKGNIRFSAKEKTECAFEKLDEKSLFIKDNILIFKYKMCNPKYNPDINKIDELIKENNISDFILDLRGNSGGNSDIIKPLINYLKTSNLNLATLVDKAVFSSGCFAVLDMKKIGSKIVGEEIGTPVNYFGYGLYGGKMPNTGFEFRFSKVYWYEDGITGKRKGIHTKQELDKMTNDFFKPKYLGIDDYIELTSNEYEQNDNDIVLERTCNLTKNNKIK